MPSVPTFHSSSSPEVGCQKNYMVVEWRMPLGHLAPTDQAPWRLFSPSLQPLRGSHFALADGFFRGMESLINAPHPCYYFTRRKGISQWLVCDYCCDSGGARAGMGPEYGAEL